MMGLARGGLVAGGVLWVCALFNWPTQAVAQLYSDSIGQAEAKAMADLRAQNDGTGAFYAYRDQKWDEAFDRGTKACSGNDAKGCDILGRVLAEGQLGAPDPRGAEAAHRKAANLYAARCKDGSSLTAGTCTEAGDFHALDAVPAVRNAALGRTYYTRARDGYTASCNRSAYECFMAGLLTDGDYTGRADPAGAVRLWRRGCEREDTSDRISSCNRLVEALAYGPAGVQNQAEARKLIEADQCSMAAPGTGGSRRVDKLFCAIVAEFLFDGLGGPKNPEMAERLMRYSCADGQESACQSLETRGLKRDDFKGAAALRDLGLRRGARERFETLCTANNGAACNEAGRIYTREAGEDDKARGLQLYGRACTLGEMMGCAKQGGVLQARGGAENLAAARLALGKACDAKDGPSCRLLGQLLAQGRGGVADLSAAVPLYEIACSGNDPSGCFYLAQSYGNGLGVPVDLTRARAFYERSCDLGDSGGCNNSAYALEIGRGGPIDLVRARGLYSRACNVNNWVACSNLGKFIRDGLGGSADPVAARALFEKACNMRVAAACNNFSDSLLSSAGGPTDRVKAISARRTACFALDNQDACTWITEGGHRDPAEDGSILVNNNKLDRGLALLREACDANSAKGCFDLANYTPTGAISKGERIALAEKACNLGSRQGCDAVPILRAR